MDEPLSIAKLYELTDRDTEPGCSELRPDDPCPCESGLPFAECHGADVIEVEPVAEYVRGRNA